MNLRSINVSVGPDCLILTFRLFSALLYSDLLRITQCPPPYNALFFFTKTPPQWWNIFHCAKYATCITAKLGPTSLTFNEPHSVHQSSYIEQRTIYYGTTCFRSSPYEVNTSPYWLWKDRQKFVALLSSRIFLQIDESIPSHLPVQMHSISVQKTNKNSFTNSILTSSSLLFCKAQGTLFASSHMTEFNALSNPSVFTLVSSSYV